MLCTIDDNAVLLLPLTQVMFHLCDGLSEVQAFTPINLGWSCCLEPAQYEDTISVNPLNHSVDYKPLGSPDCAVPAMCLFFVYSALVSE